MSIEARKRFGASGATSAGRKQIPPTLTLCRIRRRRLADSARPKGRGKKGLAIAYRSYGGGKGPRNMRFCETNRIHLSSESALTSRAVMGYAMRDEGIQSGSFSKRTGLQDRAHRARLQRRFAFTRVLHETCHSTERTHFKFDDFFMYLRYSQILMTFAAEFANGFVFQNEPIFQVPLGPFPPRIPKLTPMHLAVNVTRHAQC